MDRPNRIDTNERAPDRKATDSEHEHEHEHEGKRPDERDRSAPNPPRTTTGKMTAPKFGSATSGGGELEPGPERD